MEYLLIACLIISFILLFILYSNLQKIKSEKEVLQSKLDQLTNENTDIKNKKLKLEEELNQYRNKIIIVEKENSALKESLNINEQQLSETKNQLEKYQKENIQLHSTTSQQAQQIKNLETLLQSQKQEIETIQTKLQKEFELIAQKILDINTQKLTSQNQQVLSNTISPIKDYLQQVKELENKIRQYYDNENKERASLKTIVEHLSKQSEEVKQTAEKLANALTSQVKHQGDWGELILEKILEIAGLQEGIQYSSQKQTGDQRPDVIINLPNKKSIIIDSKVTLNAYLQYQEAKTDDEKSNFANALVKSIESHYINLSNKNYEKLYHLNSIDFVLMFVPIEGVMQIVHQYKPELFNDAIRKRVLIVTPASLLATLKTIYFIWQQEKRKEEFENILKEIEKLYDKLRVFVDDYFVKIGTALKTAQEAYDNAEKNLISGRGNALSIIGKIVPFVNPKNTIQKLLPKDNEE